MIKLSKIENMKQANNKLFLIKIQYDKKDQVVDSGFKATTHAKACILMSKMNKENRRIFLVQVNNE